MIQLELFQYDQLEQSDRDFVQGRTNEIKVLVKKSAQDIIDIGQILIEVKERLPHGMFGVWLDKEFSWGQWTAANFMRVATKFVNFTDLDEIAPSALYLLAAPSTPDEARTEAIDRAIQGEIITHKAAKEIVQTYKESKDDQPEDKDDLPSLEDKLKDNKMIIDTETKTSHAVHFSSTTPEWYTPQHIIDRVIQTFGEIDLDPCSNGGDNPNIPAIIHYSKEDDGLSKSWAGRIYMNPPYGNELSSWIIKILKEYSSGRISEAIILAPARTDTKWFQSLRQFPKCFVIGRLKFGGGVKNSAPFPSMLVYLGSNIALFYNAFSDIGDIYELRGEYIEAQ